MGQVAELTQTKRSEVIKNALVVYPWFVRSVVTGAQVIARKPSGEEMTLETPATASLEACAQRLNPEELAKLARELAKSEHATAAARLKERLVRGF